MKVYLLYESDFCHSYASRNLLGVFTTYPKLLAAAKRVIKKDLKENSEDKKGTELTDYINWNIEFFTEYRQTQGLSSFEISFETVETNLII